jgi:hypothetical protein
MRRFSASTGLKPRSSKTFPLPRLKARTAAFGPATGVKARVALPDELEVGFAGLLTLLLERVEDIDRLGELGDVDNPKGPTGMDPQLQDLQSGVGASKKPNSGIQFSKMLTGGAASP